MEGYVAAFASLCIILAPGVLELIRKSTPDSLSLCITVTGLYLIVVRKADYWGAALLVLSIWVRPDSVILAGVVLLALGLARRLDLFQVATLAACALCTVLVINHFGGAYGWSTLFYHSFVSPLPSPTSFQAHLTLLMYLKAMALAPHGLLLNGAVSLYILMLLVALSLPSTPSVYRVALALLVLTRFMYFVVYPSPDARYLASVYIVIPIALAIPVLGARFQRADMQVSRTLA